MTYDWKKNAEESGRADKLPAGVYHLEIVETRHASKGKAFASKAGDPQVMIIVADETGRQATQMITLSAKAGWVLAQILDKCGVNLDRLRDDGIEPHHFAEHRIAEQYLAGLKFYGEVRWEKGNDGKEYSKVVPLDESEVDVTKTTKQPTAAQIDSAVSKAASIKREEHEAIPAEKIPF